MKKFIVLASIVFVGFLSFAALLAHASDTDWKVLQTNVNKELTSISCPEPRICYVVSGIYLSGGSGAILKTTDGGETFSSLKSPTLNPLHSVSCPTARTCYAGGDFGSFLKTTDGGETWTELPLGNRSYPPRFTAVSALDENRVMVAGRDGAFYRSEDGGASWSSPSLRTVSDLQDIYFANSSVGFLAGNDGALFKTEDGGASWTFQKSLRESKILSRLEGRGTETLYALGDALRKSTDGGATWTQLATDLSRSYQAIAVPSVSAAYLIAETNSIFKTTNGGAAWQSEAKAESAFLRDITCPADGYCFAVGSAGKVLRLGAPPAAPPPPPPPPP
ncbi:MAG TPA: YCF48-related protein, partial [Candidatus Paceibacterota bacterium]